MRRYVSRNRPAVHPEQTKAYRRLRQARPVSSAPKHRQPAHETNSAEVIRPSAFASHAPRRIPSSDRRRGIMARPPMFDRPKSYSLSSINISVVTSTKYPSLIVQTHHSVIQIAAQHSTSACCCRDDALRAGQIHCGIHECYDLALYPRALSSRRFVRAIILLYRVPARSVC